MRTTDSTSIEETFVAFLFDADHSELKAGARYSDPCEQALMQAIAAHHHELPPRIRILRGDVPLHRFASRLMRIEASPTDASSRFMKGMSRVIGADRRSLMTTVGDLVDSFREQWNTLDLVEAPSVLGGSNVYCLAACQMTVNGASLLDLKLRKLDYYHGAVALDAGNPSHVALFSLLDCVYFEWPTLYLAEWHTGEGACDFGLSASPDFRSVILPYTRFLHDAPPRPTLMQMSVRGAESVKRVDAVTGETHHSRIANELERKVLGRGISHAINLSVDVSEADQATVPIAKLVKYALSSGHEEGKHKARLFKEELGITDRHWRFLAWQIMEALPQAEFQRVGTTDYGIQYRAMLQIVGINGASKTVESGWIIRGSGPAEMVTTYVAEKKFQRATPGVAPPWVPDEVAGDERFAAIHALADQAGILAAERCVPTPMQVVGFHIELDGEIGNALIKFDGRNLYSKWLLKNGLGARSIRKGVALYARLATQSADRVKAYVVAYQRVLWLNEIDGAEIETYLD